MDNQLNLFEQSEQENTEGGFVRVELLANRPVLLHGDCLKLMFDLPSNSVDMVCCDMPYGTTQNKWDTVLPLDMLWHHYDRIVKDRGAVVLFAQTPFDKVLCCSKLNLLRYELIWEKTKPTGHLNAKKMPMKAHENILVFYRKLPTYNPKKTTGHKPVNSYTKHTDDGECYGATKLGVSGGGNTDRYPRSIQVFSHDTQLSKLHPTQKPVALVEWLVSTYTNEGDTVLDNCMGSGTTGVACKNLNRKFIGIELDEKYYEIATKRIEAC